MLRHTVCSSPSYAHSGLLSALLPHPPPAPRRCARTVAWLEHLAGEALDAQHAAPLAPGDGVWGDTRRRLDAAAAAPGFGGRDAGALRERWREGWREACRGWQAGCLAPRSVRLTGFTLPPGRACLSRCDWWVPCTGNGQLINIDLQPRPPLLGPLCCRSHAGERAGPGCRHPAGQGGTGGRRAGRGAPHRPPLQPAACGWAQGPGWLEGEWRLLVRLSPDLCCPGPGPLALPARC
jgi:hypothetical protein